MKCTWTLFGLTLDQVWVDSDQGKVDSVLVRVHSDLEEVDFILDGVNSELVGVHLVLVRVDLGPHPVLFDRGAGGVGASGRVSPGHSDGSSQRTRSQILAQGWESLGIHKPVKQGSLRANTGS